jgi:hypothetical protein
LAGALGGILLTGGFTLATTVLNHRWSAKTDERVRREQETRDVTERLRGVFHSYLVATNAYYHAIHQMHELGKSRGDDFDVWARKEYQALQEEYQYLTISAGNEVRRLARAYDMVLYALRDAAVAFDEDAWDKYRLETHKSREEVRVAMRAELGVYDLFGITAATRVTFLTIKAGGIQNGCGSPLASRPHPFCCFLLLSLAFVHGCGAKPTADSRRERRVPEAGRAGSGTSGSGSRGVTPVTMPSAMP